jgi:hypothetical protein
MGRKPISNNCERDLVGFGKEIRAVVHNLGDDLEGFRVYLKHWN